MKLLFQATPLDTIAWPIIRVRSVLSAHLRRDLDQAIEELNAELMQRQRFSLGLRKCKDLEWCDNGVLEYSNHVA